jgi:DNA-binding NtrC family response regulator
VSAALPIQPHILVVDDEQSILFAMEQYFSAHGCTVDTAQELEEAQALLSNIRYALVLADLRLSGIHSAEGLDLVAFARERCPGARVVVLTAYGSPDIEFEARRRGAHAFLHKSTPLAEVAQVALRLLAN